MIRPHCKKGCHVKIVLIFMARGKSSIVLHVVSRRRMPSCRQVVENGISKNKLGEKVLAENVTNGRLKNRTSLASIVKIYF